MCNTYMERWSVPPSGYGSSSSHRATEKKKNRVRSRLSFFFFFFDSSYPFCYCRCCWWRWCGIIIIFFPTRKRPFVRFRSFVHSFYFSSFSFVSIQLCFFLTSIKDLHDNATTWKKKRKKRVDRVHTPRYGGSLPFFLLIVLERRSLHVVTSLGH